MSTGLLIRDFKKEYREERYAGSGSIRFSEVEHNAYRLALTLEVTHVDAPRYGNKKTMPDNTHYGYATLFKGSTVTDTIAIKYPKFRVLDIINNGIWQYHQHTENIQTLAQISTDASVFVANGILGVLGDVGDNVVCAVWKFLDVMGEDFVDKFVYNVFDCGSEEIPEDGRSLDQYRSFPIASPYPDVVKFKSDIPLSFLWRLEKWFLVNPAVYIADNPTDTSDETEDEDEYPEPEKGDGDGDGDEFPDSDAPDPDSDPKDFTGGDEPVYPPGTTVTVVVRHNAYGYGCGHVTYDTTHEVGFFGSMDFTVGFIGSVNGCDGGQTAGGIKLNVPGGAAVTVAVLQEQQFAAPSIVSKTVNLP